MVEAIGIAILSAAGTSAAVATGVGIAGVSLATIVGGATLLGGTLLLQSLTTPDTKQKVAAQQFSSRQPLPARRRVYGTVMIAGPKLEYRSANGSFYNAIYHCEGPVASFIGFWLEDVRTALPPGSLGGVANVAPWLNAVTLEGRLGSDDQAASTLLQELGYWSAEDRVAGCAYSVMRAAAPPEKRSKQVYPSGTWPEHRVLLQGSLVRNLNDPSHTQNPATWGWSDLPALCIRDHLTHKRWGMKVPAELIDDASFAAAANIDFQSVTNKAGEARPRYFIGGAFDLTEDPADALQNMLDARDGRLFLTPEGKIGLSGGIYAAPDVTLRDPQILSMTIETGSGKRASFNRLKISFVSPYHDYQVVEGDPWEDLDAQEEAGEILEADFARPWVQDHNQLRRLAKIHTAKSNPQYRITGMVTDRSGLPALFEDTIGLVLTRYGIDEVFTVERALAAGDGSTCTFDLTSFDPGCYAFNANLEEGTAPALPNVESLDATPDPPVDLIATTEARSVSGGINAVFLRLTSDEPVRQDLSLIGRYRAVGESNWLEMAAEGDARNSVISSVLVDGQEYEPQGAIAGYGRSVQSDWTPTSPPTITAIADATPTGPVTGFVANGDAGQFSYAFTTPNVENFGSARSYANSVNDFESADVLHIFNGAAGQAFDRTENGIAPGAYYVWIAAFNRSGFTDAGSRVGPISVTVT